MLVTYRRHNPLRCKHMSRSDYRCKCPIWVSGTDSKGKRRREALKLRDWTKAQELVRRWDVEGSQPKPGRRATLSEWKDSFLNDAETSRHLNAETIRKYKLLFKQLEAFAQIKKIRFAEDIGLEELTEFRATWQDAALSASKKLERLRSIYKFAVARKWVENNFAAELKTPKTSFVPTQPFHRRRNDSYLRKRAHVAAIRTQCDVRLRSDNATFRPSNLGRHCIGARKSERQPVAASHN